MILERTNGSITLVIGDSSVAFRPEWVEELRALPYEQFGTFLKSTLYPALSEEEKKIWNRSQISNVDLQAALKEFA